MDAQLTLIHLDHVVTIIGTPYPSIVLSSSNPEQIVPEIEWSHYEASALSMQTAGEITINEFASSYYETGSFSTELYNMTGFPSVKGSLIRFVAGPTGEVLAGFVLADYNVQVPHDGICLEDGLANGELCLVSTGGVAEVLMDATSPVWNAGQYIKLSPTTPGRGYNAGDFIITTDYIVGKCLITRDNPGNTLATILFSRAGRASSYALFGTYTNATNFEQVKLEATVSGTSGPGLIKIGVQRMGSGRELPLEQFGKEVVQAYGDSWKVARHSYLLGGITRNATQWELPLDGNVVSYVPFTNPGVYYLRAKIQATSKAIGLSGLFQITAAIRNGVIYDKVVTPLFVTSPHTISVDLGIGSHIEFLVTGLPNTTASGVYWGGQVELFENRT